jgi:hypothetical protein
MSSQHHYTRRIYIRICFTLMFHLRDVRLLIDKKDETVEKWPEVSTKMIMQSSQQNIISGPWAGSFTFQLAFIGTLVIYDGKRRLKIARVK